MVIEVRKIKKDIHIYISVEVIDSLKQKAIEVGLQGKGWLSAYLTFLSDKQIIVLDKNATRLLNALNLKPIKNDKSKN